MKKSLRLTFYFCVIFLSHAFAQQHNGSVTGKIIEASTKLPVEFVNVALAASKDSTIIKGVITDKKGNLKLTALLQAIIWSG